MPELLGPYVYNGLWQSFISYPQHSKFLEDRIKSSVSGTSTRARRTDTITNPSHSSTHYHSSSPGNYLDTRLQLGLGLPELRGTLRSPRPSTTAFILSQRSKIQEVRTESSVLSPELRLLQGLTLPQNLAKPVPITIPPPQLTIWTDASSTSWKGVSRQGKSAHWNWSPSESLLHINSLELLVVTQTLLTLMSLTNRCILDRIDYTAAVSLINKQESNKSRSLNELLSRLLLLWSNRNWTLRARHRQGHLKPWADSLSRNNPFITNEASVSPASRSLPLQHFPRLICSPIQAKKKNLERIGCLFLHPTATVVDSLPADWTGRPASTCPFTQTWFQLAFKIWALTTARDCLCLLFSHQLRSVRISLGDAPPFKSCKLPGSGRYVLGFSRLHEIPGTAWDSMLRSLKPSHMPIIPPLPPISNRWKEFLSWLRLNPRFRITKSSSSPDLPSRRTAQLAANFRPLGFCHYLHLSQDEENMNRGTISHLLVRTINAVNPGVFSKTHDVRKFRLLSHSLGGITPHVITQTIQDVKLGAAAKSNYE